MLEFICYPKCTTCQKAKSFLDKKGVLYKLRDIKTNAPTIEELKKWQAVIGVPVRKLFNTSGMLYRSLDLKNKLPGMSDEEMLALLASDGMLVKRPLLIGEGLVLLGFKEPEWEAVTK